MTEFNLDKITVISTSVAGVVAAWIVIRSSGGGKLLRQPAYITVAFVGIVITHFLPAVGFYLNDRTQSTRFLVLVVVSLAALAVGSFVGAVALKLRRTEVTDAYRRFTTSPITARDLMLLRHFGVLCLVMFALYLVTVPVWPLKELLSGSGTAQVNQQRRLVIGPTMGSALWPLFSVLRAAVMPLLWTLVAIAYSSALRWRRNLLIGFAVMAFVFNSWAAAKTPVTMLFLILVFVGLASQGEMDRLGKATAKRFRRILAVSAVVAIVYPLFIFTQKTFGEGQPIGFVLREGVLERVIGVPVELSFTQLELIPGRIPFTDFRDVTLYTSLTGKEEVNLSKITAAEVLNSDEANAPPAAIGTFWAEGGWPVAIVGWIVVGIGLQALQVWSVRRLPDSQLSLAFVAIFCWLAFRLSMTAAHSLLIFDGLLVTMAVASIWRRLRRPKAIVTSRSLASAKSGGARALV